MTSQLGSFGAVSEMTFCQILSTEIWEGPTCDFSRFKSFWRGMCQHSCSTLSSKSAPTGPGLFNIWTIHFGCGSRILNSIGLWSNEFCEWYLRLKRFWYQTERLEQSQSTILVGIIKGLLHGFSIVGRTKATISKGVIIGVFLYVVSFSSSSCSDYVLVVCITVLFASSYGFLALCHIFPMFCLKWLTIFLVKMTVKFCS